MFDNLDPIAVALLAFAIVGIVELAKRLYDRDFRAALIIAVAGIAGALLAPQAGDFTWFQGLLVGFQASGFVTAISYFGKVS